MTTSEEVLNETPVGLTADILAAHLQRANIMLDSTDSAEARNTAIGILDMLTGSDDERGPFDRYDVKAVEGHNGNPPMVIWYCPVCHHVGAIIRNMDGDQSNLTLGEIIGAVLDHETESH